MGRLPQGSATNPGIPGFPGLGLGFGINFENVGFGIQFQNLGFGIGFENMGSGIWIWDSFTKNPGFGIPGSQIADPWATRYPTLPGKVRVVVASILKGSLPFDPR